MKHIGTFDGRRKGAAEFNPFSPHAHVKAVTEQGDSVLEVAFSILALLAFFTALGLWIGAL